MLALTTVSFLLLAVEGLVNQVPEPLAKAVSRRMDFSTAYFRYEFERVKPGVWPTPKYQYEARFSGEEVFGTAFGDEDGVIAHHGDTGQPLLGASGSCSPFHQVRCNKGADYWTLYEGSAYVDAQPKRDMPDNMGIGPEVFPDPRIAGLGVKASSEKSPQKWLEEHQGLAVSWSERKDGYLVEVTASTKPRGSDSKSSYDEMVWRIDPHMDNSIVEINIYTIERDGSRKTAGCMKASHQKIDDRWWPKRCESTFSNGYSEVFTFSKVEFDRKKHPKALGPDILGIPPGLDAVDRIHHDPTSGPLHMGVYVGSGAVVSKTDWHNVHKDKYDPGPLIAYHQKVRAFGRGEYPRWWSAGGETLGLDHASYTPDLWETYVRRWIIRHSYDAERLGGETNSPGLSEAQVEAAWAILKDCRKRAAPIVQRMEKEPANSSASKIETTDPHKKGDDHPQESAPGESAKKPPEAANANGNGSTPKALSRHEQELARIFETLKSRLNGLLTSRQENADAKAQPKAGAKP